jgi:hypothetical protein
MGTTAFAADEIRILRRLSTPRKVQDFLDAIPMNFEPGGETCRSPRRVLRDRRSHCLEGAMLAAAALRLQGRRPLVMDLETTDDDYDHVVALFRDGGRWGAISKTNHAVLRYREPVYRTIRELAMSYFNEYFLDDGRKTLRRYSGPVDLSRFDLRGWMTAEEDVWYVEQYLYGVRHFPILTRSQIAKLRPADPVEIRAGKVVEWRNAPGRPKKA